MDFTVDIEPTTRCNAACGFCPRDQTPHLGTMAPATFTQALWRVVEFRHLVEAGVGGRVAISFCGLGEPLLNRHLPTFVERAVAAGFECSVSTNAALLDDKLSRALIDAGLWQIHVNAGSLDEEYEAVYHLDFARTRDNIERFVELSQGRCPVLLIVVDDDPERADRVIAYWRARGVDRATRFSIINRGGALTTGGVQIRDDAALRRARALLEAHGVDAPCCVVPFRYPFVGYDGQYYLCSSDWRKQVPLGHVDDMSFVDVVDGALTRVRSRQPVCASCSHDPLNVVAAGLGPSGDTADETELTGLVDRARATADETARRTTALRRAAGAGPPVAAGEVLSGGG